MKSALRNTLITVILAAIAAAIVWGFVARRTDNKDDDAPVQAQSHAAQVNGQTVLSFDRRAQLSNGIVVSTLAATRRSAETPAAATVLDLQPLLDVQSKYTVAETAIAQARAGADASEAEYKRLAELNRSGENVSEKSVEAARATSLSDAAALANAQQSLKMLEDSTRLRWTATLANWIEKGSPEFRAVLAQRVYLLQVTATGPVAWNAPSEATIQLPGGAHLAAHLIAALPQVDPRLQAPAFLYSVPAHIGLIPGLNLPVSLPAGPRQSGVIVPQSAVVWAQGSSWCYLETAPGKFTRTAVSIANPTPGGWFVTGTIAPGARVVTGGAQTLLSEEFRSEIQSQDED
jgi:membrane fusion protein, multidrug efflux system